MKHFPIWLLLIALVSCKPQSYSDYALPEYDGALSWTEVNSKAEWSKRYDHKVVVFDNQMWLLGGYTPGNVRGDSYFEDVWSSSDGSSWTEVVSVAPWNGRRGHEVVTFNDGNGEAIYLIGGFSSEEETGKRKYNNDVWKSTNGKDWVEIKPSVDIEPTDSTAWQPRSNHRCLVINENGSDVLILIGGQSLLEGRGVTHGIEYFNDVWKSTDGITWERVDNSEYGIRAEHAACVADNVIYVNGGVHGDHFVVEDNSTVSIENWGWLWTSDNGEQWTALGNTDHVEEKYLMRSDHELVFYKDRLWSLPGKTTSTVHYHFTEDYHFPIWIYSPQNGWSLDSEGAAIDARHGYGSVVFKDKIWVIGGYTNRNGQANDVWTAEI